MIKRELVKGKKYVLISILIIFAIIMMLLFHIRSYFAVLLVFIIIFLFWLVYPRTLTYFLFWILLSGGIIEILIIKRQVGYIFILLALMFLLGKHVLVEEGTR